jgi:serine/threonine-protein kinase
MGDVYRAHDERLDRTVAIKVLPERLASRENPRKRFIRETRVASKIIHPYVATVFDVVEDGNDLYLVMEYIEGRTMSALLREELPALAKVLGWAREAAEGLATIHKAGLVHRDLKPGNVMITPDGHVKLMDFGLARHIAPQVGDTPLEETPTIEPSITQDGAGVGTVIYMSPEQLHGGKADQRSDMFSFGVLLYESLTGEHPFTKQTIHESVSAIMNEPPGAGEEPPTLTQSGPVRDVVQKLLEKDPDNRYQNGEELLEDLRSVTQPAIGKGAWSSRRVLQVALAVTVGFFATAWAGYQWISRPPAWDKPRISIAVVPLRDNTGEEDGGLRASMVADLLASDLEASRIVRTVGPGQLSAMIDGLPADAAPTDIARAVTGGTMVDYVLMGTLYREGDEYLATVDVVPSSASVPEMPAVRAAGASLLALSEALATYLRRGLPEVSRLTAWRDDRTELEEINSDSEEARLLYERGLLAMRDGKIGEAIGCFEGAVEEDEEFAIAHARLAAALHSAGYGRRAREAASRAMELAPKAVSPAAERLALSIRATRAEVFGRTEEAKEATEQLATIFSDEPLILAMSARVLQLAGEFQQALARIDAALEIDPISATLHRRRAEILIRAGTSEQVHEALHEAERLFDIYGSEEGVARTAYLRGQALVTQELYEDATAELIEAEEGLSSTGNEVLAAGALLQMAEIEILQGRNETAGQRMTYAAEMASRAGDVGLQCRAVSARGALLFMTLQYAEAEPALREAVDLARQLENDQLMLSPLANLGSLLSYIGKREEARGLLQETSRVARRLGNRNGELSAKLNMADIEHQTGKLDEALALNAEVLAEDEAHPLLKRMKTFAYMNTAEILERRGRLAEALAAVDGAIDVTRDLGIITGYSDALARRSQIYGALGRFEDASGDLREARGMESSPATDRRWMEIRLTLAEGIINGHRGSWREALAAAERVLTMKGSEQPAVFAASQSLACKALIESGRAGEAIARCRAAVENGEAPATERSIALTLMARALAEAGRLPEAKERALEALAQAEGMGMLLPTARAASVLAALPADLQPDDIQAIAERGRTALESYIEAAPEENRAAVRQRKDMRRINSLLTKSE